MAKARKAKVVLTQREQKLIDMLLAKGIRTDRVERISDREFDFRLHGEHIDVGQRYALAGMKFQGRLDLCCIRYLINWCHRSVANMSSYPSMVLAGDWSGIRDSDEDTIQRIFWSKIVPLVA